MREEIPDGPGLDAFRGWKTEGQQKALELLHEYDETSWRPFFCKRPHCDGHPHHGPDGDWNWNHARADQRPPRWADDWLCLLLSGGRGSGKTRAGSEVTHQVSNNVPRIALVAATGPDLRDTMVEGVSGILATSPPGKKPLWEPSKKKLTWPNGCIAQGFSAEEPDRLRGPQSGFAWADEPAHFPLARQVWDNLLFGLRIKEGLDHRPITPKVIATSTPKPTRFIKDLIADPQTVVHRVSTYANLDNLADTFKAVILDRYEGTRLGRQELHGEVLEDVEGALWTWDMFQWIDEAPPLNRVVVGVDPAGTANVNSDETGIIVVGIDDVKNLYVLHDGSGRYTPNGWGSRVNAAHDHFAADMIVPEKNYGQDMVRFVLENAGFTGARIKGVESRRGKAIRAEPIVALYEKKRVFHVGRRGDLATLEDELTTWVPGKGASPNRLDALVHAATELARHAMPVQIADPNKLLTGYTSPTNRHLRSVR
jgi:phage terminase large subunit-like protein